MRFKKTTILVSLVFPVPHHNLGDSYDFAHMEVGDVFLADIKDRNRVAFQAFYYGRTRKKKFVVRKWMCDIAEMRETRYFGKEYLAVQRIA